MFENVDGRTTDDGRMDGQKTEAVVTGILLAHPLALNWFRKNSDDKKAAGKNLKLAFDISITPVSSADKLCEQIGPR